MKIMVVDDQLEVLGQIKAMMEPLQCEVLALADSRKAAECVQTQSFDAVFLDVVMPHVDGFELTKIVRSSTPNAKVPIVMLTGSDDIQSMRQGFKAGATYFLGKPISQERINTLFNAVLGPMLTQRRKYARLPFQTTVTCSYGLTGENSFAARSLNIGEGGMSLESATPLKIGKLVNLDFSLPSIDRQLRLVAKVHRFTPPDRYGVEFVQPPTSDRKAIREYIAGEARTQ
ncbi:MAG TPA: response regulator [Terriglobia bacterium]|nr:response regulator [Terriglobia bacterium]